jgi:S-adenosylmethionine:tRNA ribosyltransferase-isomerase
LIRLSGEVPLPPYLKRKPVASDAQRYQTVYANYEGAVAAPTAGLHFTPEVLAELKTKNIQTDFLTLHVSAGTFQPVKVDNAVEHVMHQEQVLISYNNIENLLQPGKFIIPVGTTAMRTLESLYWFGAKLLFDPHSKFLISQNDPYDYPAKAPSTEEALRRVQQYMKDQYIDILRGETSIYIMPGYSFKVCQGLITNFHQPGSTLILLVAAFVGEDWKEIYNAALNNNYRFLSYGDSSLLLPK